jgi:hypothetical protein
MLKILPNNKPFSVFLKEHSIFRTFKLNSAKNISLFYKESSLCDGWFGINKMANVGILFFIHFQMLQLIQIW